VRLRDWVRAKVRIRVRVRVKAKVRVKVRESWLGFGLES
jgi:hypothetical protein